MTARDEAVMLTNAEKRLLTEADGGACDPPCDMCLNLFAAVESILTARAALTAAAPHMGDGKGEAEWNGDKRSGGWLGKHDPAEMNTLARIVTDNAGERHPLFSFRYGIAVALLESDWLAEKRAAAWDEGHDCCINEVPGDCPGGLNHTNPYRLSPTGDDTP